MKLQFKTLLLIAFSIGNFCFAQELKSVSILGDSYSTFDGYIEPNTNKTWYFNNTSQNTDVVSVQQTWWHKFVKENNYKLEKNNSFSGSTICNTGYRKEDYTFCSFITRMKNLGSPDMILIFGATNDAWAGAPIGNYQYADWKAEELYSFRPAMAYMLDYITNRHPNVEVYFILNSELKEEINESVKTICKHYNVDCIELKDIDKKSGHPSVKGMEQINTQITAFIK
ncbi:SGNH/GDSL hydrolase family protein [Wenyingzhuangia sp. chi5]|uniref:SGNH/GDSL hydrolase family protein n=1 Tax=Wenyingzhuangia gilva TaxID=3057677 RepID=A0ABT8VMR8_9FLAO|nr:SGNH/GDSL hydrolase family protein [Wenyingzhuangia sp. chi5]MDO3693265.1 SGNH/GDSL hydrolase family protein [Wenyingzhuangia sp. chi5]